MKKKCTDIKLKKELYPRDKISDLKVEEYSSLISLLPPIVINQDNILIDGAHRLHAHIKANQEFIECNIIETKDDDDLFLKAVELNAKHGYQMTQKEKKDHIISFYKKVLNNESKSFDIERLKSSFSIPDSTFWSWTKDMNEEVESLLLQKILELYLQCKTQEEIAKIIGFETHKPIGTKLKEIEQKMKDLVENPELEIEPKYQFLVDKMNEMFQFKPIYYTHNL